MLIEKKKNGNNNIRNDIVIICKTTVERYCVHINTILFAERHRTECFVPNIKCFMPDKICLTLNANSKITNAVYRVLYFIQNTISRTLHAKCHIRITNAKKEGINDKKARTEEMAGKEKEANKSKIHPSSKNGITKSVISTTLNARP